MIVMEVYPGKWGGIRRENISRNVQAMEERSYRRDAWDTAGNYAGSFSTRPKGGEKDPNETTTNKEERTDSS